MKIFGLKFDKEDLFEFIAYLIASIALLTANAIFKLNINNTVIFLVSILYAKNYVLRERVKRLEKIND